MLHDAIERVEDKKNFTQLYNHSIKDNNLSDNAFRTFALIMSLPKFTSEGVPWKLQPAQLAKERNCSLDTMQRHLKELCDKGYAHKERIRDKKGHFKQTRWIVFSERRTPKEISNFLKKNGYKAKGQTSNSGQNQVSKVTPLNNKESNKNKHIIKLSKKQNSKKRQGASNLTDFSPCKAAVCVKAFDQRVVSEGIKKKFLNSGISESIYKETMYDYVSWCLRYNKTPRITGFLNRMDGAINLKKTSHILKLHTQDILAAKERASQEKRQFLETIYEDKSTTYAQKTIDKKRQIDYTGCSEEEIKEMEERFRALNPEQQKVFRSLRGY